MTFIELLKLLVSRASLNEAEMREANALLAELDALNAFGVVLGQTEIQTHECIPLPFPQENICRLCRKAIR